MTSSVFKDYGYYYDQLYNDKDYQAEAEYLHALMAKFKIPGNSILEFGCGTGRHASFLVKEGYLVTGLELSQDMISKIKYTEGFICHQGDIRSAKIDRKFDAVLALFHVLSYQVNNGDAMSVFLNASEHLKKDGLFIFDFWYTHAVISQLPSVRVKRVMSDEIEITRIAEPEVFTIDNRVNVNYSIHIVDSVTQSTKIIKETHKMRHFSIPELDHFAERAGFYRCDVEEYLTRSSPSGNTWGVCAIYRKR